jgi:hypothetical protein
MKTLVSAAAVAAIAGSAFGLGETLDHATVPVYTIDTPGITITKTPLSEVGRGALGVPYATATSVYGWDDNTFSSGSGFLAAPAAGGVLGAEDYGTTLSPSGPPNGSPTTDFSTFTMTGFQFVGGVDTSSGALFFDFFYNNVTTANSFGIAFPSAGNYLWTITFGSTGFIAPTEGFMQVTANTNPNIATPTGGQWFLSDAGANPVFGWNDSAFSAGSHDYGSGSVPVGYMFALGQLPSPGAAGLMGLAGLVGVSRRRRH